MWKQIRAWAAKRELARRAGRYQWIRVPKRTQYYDEYAQPYFDSMLDALVFDEVDFEREVGRLE